MKKTTITILFALLCAVLAQAESITYRIVEYNADAGDFTLAASGDRPVGSYALFENKFGATRGNRFNQIPRNNEANLWLMGWEGCVVNSVTLAMCSNNSSGSVALNVSSGEEVLYSMHAVDFSDEQWFGRWVSKDLNTYVEITRSMSNSTAVSDDLQINVKGGTKEGSVYLSAVTIDYTPGPGIATESPLGWVFEKLEKKSVINDGDVVMLYRSGSAAADIDGMETSHYLDAVGLASTSNVTDYFVQYFTLNKTPEGHWTMTNQYDEKLGATGAQALAWDNGNTEWDITLGYEGATIASTNSKYGTMRYNAPAESYARFWNYTSQSLPLPYLYRRTKQLEPVLCQQIKLAAVERQVSLQEQDTVVMRTTLLPATTTDQRLLWTSSDESVATVRSGIVELHSAGEVLITAHSADGGSEATCHIVVTAAETGIEPLRSATDSTPYRLNGTVAPSRRGLYIENGRKVIGRL